MDFHICKRRSCVTERVTSRYCRDHANEINKKAKERRLKRYHDGQCSKCELDHLPNSRLCLLHYLKRVAKYTCKDESLTGMIYDQFLKQDKKCFFTGIPLEFGVNASLDHVYPQSKYQDRISDIKNLRWVVNDVNIFKQNMELGEFISMCELITINKENIIKEFPSE